MRVLLVGRCGVQTWHRDTCFYPQHHMYGQKSTETTGCGVTEDSHNVSVEDMMIGKTFTQGFSSLIIFLKAGDKLPTIIFNTYTVILHLVTILKPSTVRGTSLRTP